MHQIGRGDIPFGIQDKMHWHLLSIDVAFHRQRDVSLVARLRDFANMGQLRVIQLRRGVDKEIAHDVIQNIRQRVNLKFIDAGEEDTLNQRLRHSNIDVSIQIKVP